MGPRAPERPLSLYVAYRALALAWAYVPFQVYFLAARGFTLSDAFDLNVVFALATVAFEVPTGVFADRYGRRRAMALGGVAMIVACGLYALGPASFAVYAAANALFALSMCLSSGADSAWLYGYLAERERAHEYARWEGLATAAKGVGNLLAVLLGGALFAFAPRGVFLLTALCSALGMFVALALPEPARPPSTTSAAGDMRRALASLAGHPRLAATMGYGALTFVLLRLSLFTDPSHVEAHLSGATAATLAFAVALLTAGKEVAAAAVASASGFLLARLRSRTVAVSLGAMACGLYAVMGLGVGTLDVLAMVLLSGAQGVFSPMMRALLNRLIQSDRDRATLLSFESMGRRVLFAAVSPLFGRALEASSLHAALGATAWVGALGYLALACVWVLAVRNARPAPPSALVSHNA